jgi:2-polyprenyl-3-methyl-5-hydroxy-6-metoxy-1,4-benzoquinol methylase
LPRSRRRATVLRVEHLHDRRVWEVRDAAEVDVPPCPACDHVRARPRFGIEGLEERVVVCARCGLGRLHPLPDEARIRAFYPADYYGHQGQKFFPAVERLLRVVGARHLRFLLRDLRPGARVLDLGCGRGVLLRGLADAGLEVHGVELSEDAVRGVDPRAHIRIAPTLTDARYEAGTFDRIIVWHVLEHLRDPRATLAEARRILRPGGEVVVAVPNFSSLQARWAGAAWFHLDLPRHLWHFPSAALRRLLEREGLGVTAEYHFSLRQNPFGWVQSALNRDESTPRNALYELLHARDGQLTRPFTRLQRARMRVAWLAGTPVAVALSVLEAAARRGATVCLVGRRGA